MNGWRLFSKDNNKITIVLMIELSEIYMPWERINYLDLEVWGGGVGNTGKLYYMIRWLEPEISGRQVLPKVYQLDYELKQAWVRESVEGKRSRS